MLDFDKVLSRLDRLRPSQRHPRTWYARCPAHDDRSPSLLVWVGRTGCLCARCLANHGCTFESIVRSIGTEPQDWFPEEHRKYSGVRRVEKQKQRIVRTFDYQGEDSNLLFQVVRLTPTEHEAKPFRQRRPDGNGGWHWNLDGVQPVLYNLPELMKQPKQSVIVVEGEKDVESLRLLGLLATCNPMGAEKWHFEYGRWLRGRNVCILPDNDEPGMRHAVQVAGNLLFWCARSIRIVQLPGLTRGGDVTDWLQSSLQHVTPEMKRESLLRFIKAVPPWQLHEEPSRQPA